MSKRVGFSFILIGVVLVLSALLLFVLNKVEDDKAGVASNFYLDNLKSHIAGNNADVTSDSAYKETNDGQVTTEKPSDTEVAEDMPVSEIDGYGFIGYITIPSLDIELPVLADWDYNKLDIAPCRQAGSIVTDDLVIAAHNYVSHFANFEYIKENADVSFTTMNNHTVKYIVTEIKVLDGKAVEDVLNSDHDLVLYTCTFEGTTRIVVFCDRV